jgi:hypothetical protein
MFPKSKVTLAFLLPLSAKAAEAVVSPTSALAAGNSKREAFFNAHFQGSLEADGYQGLTFMQGCALSCGQSAGLRASARVRRTRA